MQDFITIDAGFIPIETLKDLHWTVYSIDKKTVTFVKLPKALSNYSIDRIPFVYMSIFNEAIYVVQMDLKSYIALGNELEIDTKPPKCLFFSNAARCASTLFGSMLHHTNHSFCIGEHPALINLTIGICENFWSDKDINEIISATIKTIRKGFPSDQLFIFKTTSGEVILVPYLAQIFPEMKQIFMFRRGGLESIERMLSCDASYPILAQLNKTSEKLASIFGFYVIYKGQVPSTLKPKNMREVAMLFYATPYYTYKRNQRLFDFPIVWHHELIATPEKILKPIFEKLNIPDSCIPDALARMQTDSQDNTFLSQKSMKHLTASKIMTGEKEVLKFYANELQMELDVLRLEN
uniref:Uncharacterized protein n=1 Tax=Panagrolaimus davidi TaxID=227884 RepID=A0A914P9W5_9BILA